MERKEKIIIAVSVGVMLIVLVAFILWLVLGRKAAKGSKLTKKEVYAKAGKQFNLDPNLICAIARTESSSGGYLPDGRPSILFEGHVFWSELEKRRKDPNDYLPEYADVLNPTWDKSKYGKGGAYQHDRLARAEQLCKEIGLDNTAALNAAGWGSFGIQGFSSDKAGYPSVQAMVKDFRESPNRDYVNVMAFLNFCANKTNSRGEKPILPALRAKDWQTVAYNYNGAGYAKNQYDTKMAANYEKCKNEL